MPTAKETLQRFKEFVYPNHPVLTASVDTLLEKDLIRILKESYDEKFIKNKYDSSELFHHL